MADENVRAIVREELAKVSPKSNHSTPYQHAQSLIRSAAHNSAREISHVNPGINSSSSSTLTAAKESRRNSTSTSDEIEIMIIIAIAPVQVKGMARQNKL